jgi:hypothetical protein
MNSTLAYGIGGFIVIMIVLVLLLLFNVRKARSYIYYEDHSLRQMNQTEDLKSNILAHSLNA